jgi:hypothetical protein
MVNVVIRAPRARACARALSARSQSLPARLDFELRQQAELRKVDLAVGVRVGLGVSTQSTLGRLGPLAAHM